MQRQCKAKHTQIPYELVNKNYPISKWDATFSEIWLSKTKKKAEKRLGKKLQSRTPLFRGGGGKVGQVIFFCLRRAAQRVAKKPRRPVGAGSNGIGLGVPKTAVETEWSPQAWCFLCQLSLPRSLRAPMSIPPASEKYGSPPRLDPRITK